jgi:hypothetical protein
MTERYLLESISQRVVEETAKRKGWKDDGSGEGLRELIEPNDCATHTIFDTLDAALKAGRELIVIDPQFYGCCIVEKQVLEPPHDDRGRRVRGAPTWELTGDIWEIDSTGDVMEVTA